MTKFTVTAKVDEGTLDMIGKACRYVLGPVGEHWTRKTAEVALRTKFHLWEVEQENIQRINDLAEEKWNSKPFRKKEPSLLDSKSAYEFITNASKESDPNLQELWANLLVESSKPDGDSNIDRVAIETLSRLDSKTSAVFDWLMTNSIVAISPQPFSHCDWGEDKRFFLVKSDIEELSGIFDGPIVRSLAGFRQLLSESFQRAVLISTEKEMAYQFILCLDRLEKLCLIEQCPLARQMENISSDLKVYFSSYFGRQFHTLVSN